MDNVTEVVALLRKQAELECQIENGDTASAVHAEQELERTRRRLTAHPHAVRAVLAGPCNFIDYAELPPGGRISQIGVADSQSKASSGGW